MATKALAAYTVNDLVAAYRKQTLSQRAVLIGRLLPLWKRIDSGNIDKTFPLFELAATALVQAQRQKAIQLAQQHYMAVRTVQQVSGLFTPVEPLPLPLSKLSTVLTVTGLAGFKIGIRDGMTEEQAKANAFVRLAGSTSRLVLDAGRETIVSSAIRDPEAQGWRRKYAPNACDFCKKVNGFGRVYTTESIAEFRTHDHCACSAEVVYDD